MNWLSDTGSIPVYSMGKTAEYLQQGFRSFCVYDIMSLDIISARSEAEWPSKPEASCDRKAIIRIMSLDMISARSEAKWPSKPEASCDRKAIIREQSHIGLQERNRDAGKYGYKKAGQRFCNGNF